MFETSPDARIRRANETAHALRGEALSRMIGALFGRRR